MCNSNQKHTALSYLNGVNITGSRWTLHEKKNRIKYLNLVISKQKRSTSERITNSTGNSAPRCQPGHSVHCVLYSAAHHCSNNTCKCPLERSLDTSAQLNIETDKSSRTAHSLTPGGKREKQGPVEAVCAARGPHPHYRREATHKCQLPGMGARLAHAMEIIGMLPFSNVTLETTSLPSLMTSLHFITVL